MQGQWVCLAVLLTAYVRRPSAASGQTQSSNIGNDPDRTVTPGPMTWPGSRVERSLAAESNISPKEESSLTSISSLLNPLDDGKTQAPIPGVPNFRPKIVFTQATKNSSSAAPVDTTIATDTTIAESEQPPTPGQFVSLSCSKDVIKKSMKRLSIPSKCHTAVLLELHKQVYGNKTEEMTEQVSKKMMKDLVKNSKTKNLSYEEVAVLTDVIHVKARNGKHMVGGQPGLEDEYMDFLGLVNLVIDNEEALEEEANGDIWSRLMLDMEFSAKLMHEQVKLKQVIMYNLTNIIYNAKVWDTSHEGRMVSALSDHGGWDSGLVRLQSRSALKTNYVIHSFLLKGLDGELPVRNEIVEGNGSFINSHVISINVAEANGTDVTEGLSAIVRLHHLLTNESLRHVPVFWQVTNESYGYWSSRGCRTLQKHKYFTEFYCTHLTSFALLATGKLDDSVHSFVLSLLTITGLSVSIAGEVLSVLALFIARVATRRRKILMHLLLNLMAAHVLFLTAVTRATVTKTLCGIVAFLLSFFLMNAFYWMLNLAINLLIYTSVNLMNVKIAMWKFCLVAYGSSGVLQILCLSIWQGRGFGNEEHCWLSTDGGAFWVFSGNILTIIILNSIVSIRALHVFGELKMIVKQTHVKKIWKILRAMLMLVPSLGLAWLFGVLVFVDGETIWLQYAFVLTCSTQGFMIFISCCLLDEKVRESMRAWLRHPTTTRRNFSVQHTE